MKSRLKVGKYKIQDGCQVLVTFGEMLKAKIDGIVGPAVSKDQGKVHKSNIIKLDINSKNIFKTKLQSNKLIINCGLNISCFYVTSN